ncbi:tRNA(Phe) (4-demethylwyosine(37)-C(7)) aminocarboxypropyltransferase Taw2 [Thermococcus aciditolerans]|uniref:tRNA(Phe) (4-demethylwyosine(37)-C(7)) aminocarboxypropyltransferase n=1 Tax=Thermococcus aciditolerans TaxID=2598455 RepID=A0A5C0SJL4_9EURY|nr:class I SAM-dependent methyltransferase family protein [Thermococcus aciditolerans]QEK13916.1 class I SAM-dependent methyltransferase family protein [Thermococcus aciditolerans]
MGQRNTKLIKPRIRKTLSRELPGELVEMLPKHWVQIGDVLILPLRQELEPYKHRIAEVYAQVIGVKTVLRKGRIGGEFRETNYEVLYGSDTVTVHIENGIRYKLDVAKVMFSPANVKERVRMARVARPGELVVDMFAGIGHLSLPMAVHGKARVIAIEKSPYTFQFLVENIELNRVQDRMTAYNIDNRDFPGENVADRILMGYVVTTHEFIPKALSIAKDEAIIHYHNTVPERLMPEEPFRTFQEIAREYGYETEKLNELVIKRYAPGVWHVVVDVRVFKR